MGREGKTNTLRTVATKKQPVRRGRPPKKVKTSEKDSVQIEVDEDLSTDLLCGINQQSETISKNTKGTFKVLIRNQ